VLHGDLQPSNIFCLDHRYVLADFEIARPVVSAEGTITEIRATGDYASPEQLTGGEVSSRSDLYALGMIAYEALTGRKWRSGVPPADAAWSGVPRWLRGVLRTALAPRPGDRWADATSFMNALDAAEPRKKSGRAWAYAALVIVVLLLFTALRERISAKVPGAPPRQMAILPFETEGSPTSTASCRSSACGRGTARRASGRSARTCIARGSCA
jgi:serine/threonine protein kinase